MFPNSCVKHINDSYIKLAEGRTSIVISNTDRVTYSVIRFDGCVVCQSPAADWIVKRPAPASEPGACKYAIIELKGKNLKKSQYQIESTISFLQNKGLKFREMSVIISFNQIPRIDTSMQRFKNHILKKYKTPVHFVNGRKHLNFESMLTYVCPYSK